MAEYVNVLFRVLVSLEGKDSNLEDVFVLPFLGGSVASLDKTVRSVQASAAEEEEEQLYPFLTMLRQHW